ncbi:hypothetical protein LguiA_012364 [Lonicera macranthoides]
MAKNLTEDFLIKILSSLPVKSLLQSSAYARTGFISSNPFLYFSDDDIPCALAIFHDETHEDIIDFTQGIQDEHGIHIIGPVDGLFLLHACMSYFPGTNDNLALWNPATQEFRRLSKPKFRPGARSDYAATALYTFGAESWKQIENPNVLDSVRDIWWRCSGDFIDRKEYYDGVYLNGSFYWLVECRCGRQIGLFDMGTDEFRKITAPNGIEAAFRHLDLVLHNDSITLLEKEYTSIHMTVLESIHVWIMGEEGSWTKLFTVALGQECQLRQLLGFWKSHKEIFYETSANQLVFCDYNTRKAMYLGVHGHRSGNFLQLYKFKESLVSVKGVKMNREKLRDAIRDFFPVLDDEELPEE